MEPEPLLDPDDAPVPAHLQALADASAEPEAEREETSFHSLLVELDSMEEGLKTDFEDLLDEPSPPAEEAESVEDLPRD
jgi:segregation and condensation protein B